MTNKESGAGFGHSGQPEIILPDHLKLPNLRFLTAVTPPIILDKSDPILIASWLEEMVEEEKKTNSEYRGILLYGSIAQKKAVGGSDIDIIHIVEPYSQKREYLICRAIEYRLLSIITVCFNTICDSNHYLNLRDYRSCYDVERLDKYTIPIGITDPTIQEIQNQTQYQNREPFSGSRLNKEPSQDVPMPEYTFPKQGIFPSWTEYGLLTPIKTE